MRTKKKDNEIGAEQETIGASAEVEKNKVGMTNVLVIVMALIFIAMSTMMIFVEGIEAVYLCYGMCIAAIISGIFMIVRYFMTDAFRNVNAYGFSLGTLLVILSLCGFLKAEQMATAILTILGIILLLSGIIVLQHSLDLHRLKDVIWIPALVIAALILICSVVVILQPMADKFGYDLYVWWMILISASLSFIINIYTMIKVALFKKKETRIKNSANAEQRNSELKDKADKDKTAEATEENETSVDLTNTEGTEESGDI